MDKLKMISFRKIVLLTLSILFLVFRIISLTTSKSIGFDIAGLIIIYIPCLVIMFYKPVVASLLFGILLITQVLTNGSVVILSIISMKMQIFEFENLRMLIGYIIIVVLSVIMIMNIWKCVFQMKPQMYRIPIYVLAILYIIVSLYLSIASFEKAAFISNLASIFFLALEVIHITTEEKNDSKSEIVIENEKSSW